LLAKDAYPLPRLEDILSQLAGKLVLSELDMVNGYYQYSMDDDSREKPQQLASLV
jgi:hypothetical protein